MGEALVAGLLAGYGVAVPVGAIAALIVSLTARTSWRIGVAAALGVATADGLYAIIAVAGGAAISGLITPIATPLRWSAAAVLLVLAGRTAVVALRSWRDGAEASRSGLSSPGRAYFGLLGLTLLNPATVIYFAALVLGRQPDASAAAAVFVAAAFAASASWQLVIAGSGALLGRALTSPRARLVTALSSSLIIAALALRLLWT